MLLSVLEKRKTWNKRQKDNGCYVDPKSKCEIMTALRVEMTQFRQEIIRNIRSTRKKK